MTRNDLPVSKRQLLNLALVVFVPLLLAMAAIAWAPAKPGQSNALQAAGIVGAIALVLSGMLYAMLTRHAIDFADDALLVRHSLYTLRIPRRAVTGVSVREVATRDQLGLASRHNGIAAFGYLSGWFTNVHGERVFCAISASPLFLLTFEGAAPSCRLALSASAEVVRHIENWCIAA